MTHGTENASANVSELRYWGEPDFQILAPDRSPPPRFPLTQVFGSAADWIADAARRRSAPPDYVAGGLLIAAGSLIAGARWVCATSDWEEPPILFGCLVGNPSAGKSPAMDTVVSEVRKLERTLSAGHAEKMSEFEETSEAAKIAHENWKDDVRKAQRKLKERPRRPEEAVAPERPVRPRLCVTDATIEALAELQSELDRPLLLVRDELSGWLGNLDRYGGRGGDRAFFLEAFGGRSFVVDRVKRDDPIQIKRLLISILGGIQIDRLESLLTKSDDDGLLARFLVFFPYPPEIEKLQTRPKDERLKTALTRLHDLQPDEKSDDGTAPRAIPLDVAAKEIFHRFRLRCRELEMRHDGLLISHIGKFPGLALRISLILTFLDWAFGDTLSEPTSVCAKALGKACHFLEYYALPMALRTYGEAGARKEVRSAKALAAIIRGEGWTRFKPRDVISKKRKGLSTTLEVQSAAELLREANLLRSVKRTTGRSGPKSFTYEVNPKLLSWNSSGDEGV